MFHESRTNLQQSQKHHSVLIYLVLVSSSCAAVLSRFFSLHRWLKNFCSATGSDFILNFDSFWTNSSLYRLNGVRLNRKGTKQMTTNFAQFIAFSPWYEPRHDSIQASVSPCKTSSHKYSCRQQSSGSAQYLGLKDPHWCLKYLQDKALENVKCSYISRSQP